jgi:hypothetical protein
MIQNNYFTPFFANIIINCRLQKAAIFTMETNQCLDFGVSKMPEVTIY